MVDMMDEDYDTQKDLVWMAVDGIYRVFEMPVRSVHDVAPIQVRLSQHAVFSGRDTKE